MQIEVLDPKSSRVLLTVENVNAMDTIGSLKHEISSKKPKLYPSRQALRLEPKGKALSEEQTIGELNLPSKGAQLYLRDLGPQVSWTTVFLVEYAGPLIIYPICYFRPFSTFIYGSDGSKPMALAVHLACLCWTVHYAKRLLETVFVHRFSHATMPLTNIFKNSCYYWGFTLFISYFINHPLYTAPASNIQVYLGLVGFGLSELGNLSIHLLLRDLRPPGTKQRRIPVPNSNPLTALFNFVSCPNYTYETSAWLFFSVMTQSLPALIFTVAGFAQMAIWARAKHRNYRREFPNYPRGRTAILPFLL